MNEELTREMRDEFTVSRETEREHLIIFAHLSVQSGHMTKEKALEWYGITDEEFGITEAEH